MRIEQSKMSKCLCTAVFFGQEFQPCHVTGVSNKRNNIYKSKSECLINKLRTCLVRRIATIEIKSSPKKIRFISMDFSAKDVNGQFHSTLNGTCLLTMASPPPLSPSLFLSRPPLYLFLSPLSSISSLADSFFSFRLLLLRFLSFVLLAFSYFLILFRLFFLLFLFLFLLFSFDYATTGADGCCDVRNSPVLRIHVTPRSTAVRQVHTYSSRCLVPGFQDRISHTPRIQARQSLVNSPLSLGINRPSCLPLLIVDRNLQINRSIPGRRRRQK